MIRFDDVTISYPDSPPVLSHASFIIPDGDLVVVVGRTGTGKSTLLGAINGLVPHFTGGTLSGDVVVNGRSTRDHRPRDLADVVGYVGQNPLAGFVTDRVEDEIAYGMEQLGRPPVTMRKRVEETLDLMNIADLRRRPLLDLSGGQQQRVAIAAVLAAQPRVLVLDEPTSALDPTAAQDVLAAITTLVHDVGLTVVLAEHRLERVMQAADQVLWLPGDGSAELGPAREVLARADVTPPLVELSRTFGWPQVPLSVREARRHVTTEGIVLDPPHPEPTRERGRTALQIEKLGVRYGDVLAVNDVTCDFASGEITALMGRNGAGKSSLMWALQGATASSGTISVTTGSTSEDPREVTAGRARQLVSLVPQSAADLLYLHTVEGECAQSDRETESSGGTTAAILTRLGADLDPQRHPRDLSEGQRLALVLAIQLAASPGVVLLDEPTRGLDYAMKAALRTILTELAASGTCVIVSTHDVEFAAQATTRTVVLADGDIVADGTTREVCTSSPAFAPQVAKIFHPLPVLTVAEAARGLR